MTVLNSKMHDKHEKSGDSMAHIGTVYYFPHLVCIRDIMHYAGKGDQYCEV